MGVLWPIEIGHQTPNSLAETGTPLEHTFIVMNMAEVPVGSLVADVYAKEDHVTLLCVSEIIIDGTPLVSKLSPCDSLK